MRYKRRFSTFRAFWAQARQWRRLTSSVVSRTGTEESLVIVPCDPWSVGGSRGDEAMITAVLQRYRKEYPEAPVAIVSGGKQGSDYIGTLPFERIADLPVWTGNYPMERIYRAVMERQPARVVLLGADCMDGFYSPQISLMLLGLHDLFSRTPGVDSRLLGFSFNAKPYGPMCRAFGRISDRTRINLRDAVSLERFVRMTGTRADLVADAAFMLCPDSGFDGYAALEHWIAGRRSQGTQRFIGFNFHPMLRAYNGPKEIEADALVLARNLETILREDSSVDFVLIPHDDRSRLTDNLMLGTIAEYLQGKGLADRIYYRSEVYRAFQLKALCRLLDGLVCSRMHLAIAALGQGRCVLAASYQGKFEGLFRHFGLSTDYLLSPDAFISDRMVEVFRLYLKHLPELTEQVKSVLPAVLKLSEKNLA